MGLAYALSFAQQRVPLDASMRALDFWVRVSCPGPVRREAVDGGVEGEVWCMRRLLLLALHALSL